MNNATKQQARAKWRRLIQRLVQHSSAMIFFTVAAGSRPSARWREGKDRRQLGRRARAAAPSAGWWTSDAAHTRAHQRRLVLGCRDKNERWQALNLRAQKSVSAQPLCGAAQRLAPAAATKARAPPRCLSSRYAQRRPAHRPPEAHEGCEVRRWRSSATGRGSATRARALTFSSSAAISTHGPHQLRARSRGRKRKRQRWQMHSRRVGCGCSAACLAKKSITSGLSRSAMAISSSSAVMSCTFPARTASVQRPTCARRGAANRTAAPRTLARALTAGDAGTLRASCMVAEGRE